MDAAVDRQAPLEADRAADRPGGMTPASFSGTPRTRIQIPDLAIGSIERRGLLERLASTQLHPEALVVGAPAGFGKTTLLTQWAHRARNEGRPVAWVTCRTVDGDPTTLLVDLRDATVLAVRDMAPQVGAQLRDSPHAHARALPEARGTDPTRRGPPGSGARPALSHGTGAHQLQVGLRPGTG